MVGKEEKSERVSGGPGGIMTFCPVGSVLRSGLPSVKQ